jgi:hypothetical protein
MLNNLRPARRLTSAQQRSTGQTLPSNLYGPTWNLMKRISLTFPADSKSFPQQACQVLSGTYNLYRNLASHDLDLFSRKVKQWHINILSKPVKTISRFCQKHYLSLQKFASYRRESVTTDLANWRSHWCRAQCSRTILKGFECRLT